MGEVVGTCEFDLATLLGDPVDQTASIVPEDYTMRHPNEIVLKGNATSFPGAQLEFRVTIKDEEQPASQAPTLPVKKLGAALKRSLSPSLTQSRDAEVATAQIEKQKTGAAAVSSAMSNLPTPE